MFKKIQRGTKSPTRRYNHKTQQKQNTQQNPHKTRHSRIITPNSKTTKSVKIHRSVEYILDTTNSKQENKKPPNTTHNRKTNNMKNKNKKHNKRNKSK